MPDLKQACSHCSGRIAYEQEHVGLAIDCPHCGVSITLDPPLPAKLPVMPSWLRRKDPPPPPPPPPAPPSPAKLPSGPSPKLKVPKRPNYVAEAAAYEKEAVKAGWEPQQSQRKPQRTGGSSWRGLIQWGGILITIGCLIWNFFLSSDSGAEHLIKKSMEETLSEEPAIAKPVVVTNLILHDGPDSGRTGTAIISTGGRTVSVQFTAKITHTRGNVEAAWEMAATEVAKLAP